MQKAKYFVINTKCARNPLLVKKIELGIFWCDNNDKFNLFLFSLFFGIVYFLEPVVRPNESRHETLFSVRLMVFILDGSSEIGAHVKSNLFYLICFGI